MKNSMGEEKKFLFFDGLFARHNVVYNLVCSLRPGKGEGILVLPRK